MTMKKLITLILCFIVVYPVFAKNYKDKNEFSITYGQFTLPQVAYVTGAGLQGIVNTGVRWLF